MIIAVRGTSGSGKSTLVRRVMDYYDDCLVVNEEGRKRPLAYFCERAGGRSLYVPGHYETPCGGCDTIKTLDQVYAMVRRAHAAGSDVLFEGLLLNSDRRRLLELRDFVRNGEDLVVITLSTSLEECVESINLRRRQKDPGAEPVDPANTEAKYKLALKNHQVFGLNLNALLLSRDQALQAVVQLLELG